jgi:hypothetical protein
MSKEPTKTCKLLHYHNAYAIMKLTHSESTDAGSAPSRLKLNSLELTRNIGKCENQLRLDLQRMQNASKI